MLRLYDMICKCLRLPDTSSPNRFRNHAFRTLGVSDPNPPHSVHCKPEATMSRFVIFENNDKQISGFFL